MKIGKYVVFAVLSIVFLLGGVSADTVTEELTQDADFTASDNSAYWSRLSNNNNYWGSQANLQFSDGYAKITVDTTSGSITQGIFFGVAQDISLLDYTESITITVKTGYVKANSAAQEWIEIWDSGAKHVLWNDKIDLQSNNRVQYTLDSSNAADVFSNLGSTVKFAVDLHFISQYNSGTTYEMDVDYAYFNITYESSGGGGGDNNNTNNNNTNNNNTTNNTNNNTNNNTSNTGGSSGGLSGGSGGSGGSWNNGGGYWWGHTTNGNATLVQKIADNMQIILGVISGITIAVLWVKVAINWFSDDPQRKLKAREDMTTAITGTIIIAVAVLGAAWMLSGWLIGGA